MNWRRGLFRLWVIVSVAWVAVAYILIDPIQAPNQAKIAEAMRQNYSPDQITAYLSGLRRDRLIDFGALAMVPPTLILIAGAIGFWVVVGFRSSN